MAHGMSRRRRDIVIRAAAVVAIRLANGRTSGANTSRASAIPPGQAREPSACMLTPSRAALITLIGILYHISGPISSPAGILVPEHRYRRNCIDNSPGDLHPGPRELRTAHENASRREP